MTIVRFMLVLCLSAVAWSVGARDASHPSDALHAWFDKLASGKGLCCSVADGVALADVDWGTQENRYWVMLYGYRYTVPPEAVVTEPNRFGAAVVWPLTSNDDSLEDAARAGHLTIRCFIAGAGT